jgi:hypothetical protein
MEGVQSSIEYVLHNPSHRENLVDAWAEQLQEENVEGTWETEGSVAWGVEEIRRQSPDLAEAVLVDLMENYDEDTANATYNMLKYGFKEGEIEPVDVIPALIAYRDRSKPY